MRRVITSAARQVRTVLLREAWRVWSFEESCYLSSLTDASAAWRGCVDGLQTLM